MKHDLNCNLQRRAKRLYALFACLVLTLPFAVVPAFAADDPLSVVTSLSDFIFSLIRGITSSRDRKCVPGHSSSQNVLIVPPPIEDALDLHHLS